MTRIVYPEKEEYDEKRRNVSNMKIEGPQGPQKSSGSRKSSGASASDASAFRSLMATDETSSSASSAPAQHINALDILLAVQGADDPAGRAARKRMMDRSDDILEALENIKNGLLMGTLTVGDVINVADVVASHREKISDPTLTELMDEIDLRAQVEIAKLRYSIMS